MKTQKYFKTKKSPEISIILPCRNEEQALDKLLIQIKEVIKKHNLSAEIIVSDSSTDSSPKIAKQHKVKLIKHDKEGYGNAYLQAFPHAKGKYLFLADADGTYDPREIPRFINELKQGNDFVIGNRFKGKIEEGSMPWHHRHIGNPILSSLLRIFFKTKIHDTLCGMRAIKNSALQKLSLKTTGMEFAYEMIIKAIKNNLKIKELPINYSKRLGISKLRSFADGWRHLRFMLLYSPLYLFFLPGIILSLLGLISMLWFYLANPKILGFQLYFHPMFLSSLMLIIGYQLIIFTLFARSYALNHLEEKSELITKITKHITIEKASVAGLLLALIGSLIYLTIFIKWLTKGFPALNEIKNSILALTLIVMGVQTIFSSFMLSILGIKK